MFQTLFIEYKHREHEDNGFHVLCKSDKLAFLDKDYDERV